MHTSWIWTMMSNDLLRCYLVKQTDEFKNKEMKYKCLFDLVFLLSS